MSLEQWNRIAASNNDPAKGGHPENHDRDEVNDFARRDVGAIRTWWEDGEWTDRLQEESNDFTVSRVNATTFRVTDADGTDATEHFQVGSWVKVTGTSSPTVAYGLIATIGAYGAPNVDIILEGIVDENHATSTLPDTTITKIECYFLNRAKQAAFHPVGTTTGQAPQELPPIDALGDGALLDMGHGNGQDADTVDTFHAQDLIDFSYRKYRNVLTNGAMQVWQRGYTIDGSTSYPNDNDAYCADCVNHLAEVNDRFDITRERALVPHGFRNAISLEAVNTTAGPNSEQGGIVMFAEGEDCRGIVQVTTPIASARFDARVSLGASMANIRAAIIEWRSTEDAITSDVVGTWNGAGVDPTLAANWFYASVPESLATFDTGYVGYKIENVSINSTTKNLALFIWLDDTSYSAGDKLYFGGLQLEAGVQATDFEHLPMSVMVDRCEWQFRKTYDLATAPGTVTDAGRLVHPTARTSPALFTINEAVIPWRFPRMRVAPTVVIRSPGTGATGNARSGAADVAATAVDIGESGLTIDITGNPTADYLSAHATADSSL